MSYSLISPYLTTFTEPDKIFPALDIVEVDHQLINCITDLHCSNEKNSEKIVVGLLKNIRRRFKYSTEYKSYPCTFQIDYYLCVLKKIKFMGKSFLLKKNDSKTTSENSYKNSVDKTHEFVLNAFTEYCKLIIFPFIKKECLASIALEQPLRICDHILLLESFNRAVFLIRKLFRFNTSNPVRLNENKNTLELSYTSNHAKLLDLYITLKKCYLDFRKHHQFSEMKKIILKFENQVLFVELTHLPLSIELDRANTLLHIEESRETVFAECKAYEKFIQNPQAEFLNFKNRLLQSLSWLDLLVSSAKKDSFKYNVRAEKALEFLEGKRFFNQYFVIKVKDSYELQREPALVMQFVVNPQDVQPQNNFISIIKHYLFEMFDNPELGIKSLNKYDSFSAFQDFNERLRNAAIQDKVAAFQQVATAEYNQEQFKALINALEVDTAWHEPLKATINAEIFKSADIFITLYNVQECSKYARKAAIQKVLSTIETMSNLLEREVLTKLLCAQVDQSGYRKEEKLMELIAAYESDVGVTRERSLNKLCAIQTISNSFRKGAGKHCRFDFYSFAKSFNTFIGDKIFPAEQDRSVRCYVNATGNVSFKLKKRIT